MGSDTTEQLTFSFIKGTATQNLIIHNSPVKNIRPFNDLVNGTVETHIAGSTFNISQNGILTGSDISGQKYIVPIDKTIKIATNVPKGIVSGVLSDHQNWDGAFADFQRFFELETNATTPVVSNIHAKHHPIYSQTMFVAIDGVLQTDMGIQFKDPWKVVNGIRPWNWDSYLRPFTPGTGIDTEYGGLFKGVSYFESNPGFAHYKVKTNDLISSNGLEGYFSNWDGTGSYFYNRTSLETPVRFDAANAVVTANYKGHLRTGVPQNTDSKNQYRLTNMGVYTNNLMVYESMGKCWIASTGDNGANWSQEKQLSTSIGGKNPSLSNTIYYYNKPIAVAAWVDTAGGVYDVHLQSLTNQGGSDYWGWEWTNQPSVRNASNHLSLTQLVGEDARSDARPVVWLSREGDDVILTWAFEGTNSGILTGQLWLDGNGVSLPEIAAGQPYVTGGQMWDMSLVISSSVNDKYPVLISYPAAYSQPARLALYYLGTGYAAGHRIVEYDYLTTTKRVLATAPNDYTYLSLSGASNETSASFALVATAQVNYPTTSYNTNIYTKPTYSGNSLPTVAKVYTNTVSPAIMVQNTASFGSPVYQVHMTNSGTSTRVKADGGSSITTIAPTSAGSWVSAQVPAGIRKAMVVRSTTTPATIQYYSGSGSLTKAGDFSVDVRAYRYYTLKSGVSGGAILDFSGSRVESVDSLETGENLAVIEVREPSVNGVLVRQPDSLAVPLSVDVIRDGASIAAYAAASWKVLGVASFTDLQTGDLLRFRLADPAVSIWGFEVYSVWEEGLQKDSPEENPVTQLDELKEGIRLYPNPFNPVTTFEISLKAPQTVRLAVYNLLGQQVSELVSGELGAGRHSFPFNGSNLSSGTYFYRLETAGEVKTGKLQLLK
ncbi:MAG: T9SS type A sorting domain-containing protein [Bacteroidetes bacterium]|nr:T9SS type A sorting domain-containing protein [Bacteroidota bacterium]